MIDRLRVIESYLPDNAIDCHGEMPLAVVKRPRAPLPPALKVVLPEEASSSPMQQPALTSLRQQMLQIASSQSDCSQILTALAACIGNAFNADGCAIALPNSTGATAQVVYWLADAPPRHMQQLKTMPALFQDRYVDAVPISIAHVGALQANHAFALNAHKFLEIWQPIASLRAPSLQVVALLGTTTHAQGRVNGAISLMRSRTHAWTQSEIAGLQTVSHQVASTIDQLQHQLSQQMQHQRVVNQLTLAIHNASDLSTILKLATDGTAQALQVQRGMLLRLKHWDTLFRNRAQAQLPKIRVNVACEWLSDETDRASLNPHLEPSPIADQALTTGTNAFWLSECTLCQQAFLNPDSPIMLSGGQLTQSKLDAATSNHLDSSIATTFNVESLPTLLLAPLESKGIVLGFLVFQQDQPRFWQPEELALVQLVSAQVSTAIIQTETLRQVQSLVEKRTAELRESLSMQAKLYDRTRYQLDQLRHLNQAKDEFLSTVSHELRTPLTSMTMAIRMLRQVGLSGERSARYLDILEQQCAQETNLINDLLGLQELESNQVAVNRQEIDLKALMHDLIRQFQQKWSAKGLTLETKLPKRSLRLLSDRDSLHRILFELLTNAGKYSDPNSRVQFHVAQKKDPANNQIIVTLNNIGQGIAPDELPLIFDKFKRGQGATQNAVQGTGLGLALVKSLVQHLNGDITASSRATEDAHTYETCFTLTLPQTFAHQKLHQ